MASRDGARGRGSFVSPIDGVGGTHRSYKVRRIPCSGSGADARFPSANDDDDTDPDGVAAVPLDTTGADGAGVLLVEGATLDVAAVVALLLLGLSALVSVAGGCAAAAAADVDDIDAI